MALTPDPTAPAGVIPSTKGSAVAPRGMTQDRRRRRLRHGQPALGVAGGDACGADSPGSTSSSPPTPEEVRAAERVVLPGQGAMRDCMRELRDSGPEGGRAATPPRSKPLMGVCVGMQMLLDHSEEQDTPGLGLIPGEVLRFRLDGRLQPDGSRYKVPQMGWNRVTRRRLTAHVGRCARRQLVLLRAQLLCRPSDPRHSAGLTDYGDRFTCAWRGITFLRPSSTPRRAPSTAWPCTATSCTGSPGCLAAPPPPLPLRHGPLRAMLLIPAIDLKDGKCVRLKQGDMNAVHHLRRRPGRDGAALARRRRAPAAPGRPERRLRRQAGQRGGVKAILREVGDEHPGAARRRHPRPRHHRALPRRRHQLRHHRHRGGQEPGLPEATPAAPSAATSSSAWTPGTARSPPTAGASSPATRSSTWRRSSRTTASRRDLHRHRPRRHAHRHQHRGHRQAGAGADHR
jgi:glutamine amidotransferase